MSEWSSTQYVKFKDERTQPAIDLANRIPIVNPTEIIDIGCGPGNSTAVLRQRYQQAHIVGIDSSENMIGKAKQGHENIDFSVCDANKIPELFPHKFDVVFSNACLQWIPNHKELLPYLYSLVNEGGVLAVQIPKNGKSPLYKAMDQVIDNPKWKFDMVEIDYNGSMAESEYFDILSALTPDFTMWETSYFHRMTSHDALVEWISGTKLRPYLNVLDEEKQILLKREIVDKLMEVYPTQENGEIIFPFKRLFYIASK